MLCPIPAVLCTILELRTPKRPNLWCKYSFKWKALPLRGTRKLGCSRQTYPGHALEAEDRGGGAPPNGCQPFEYIPWWVRGLNHRGGAGETVGACGFHFRLMQTSAPLFLVPIVPLEELEGWWALAGLR